jgi:hypothetical protein
MAKDPAVLFYTSDFLSGTFTMTNEQRGMYITLLCLQHQKGTLTESDMLSVCLTYVEQVYCKFIKNGAEYYNERMKNEHEKRSNFCKSRRDSVMKGIENKGKRKKKSVRKTYAQRMEDENVNKIVIYSFINNEKFNSLFNRWTKYKLDRKETYKSNDSLETCYKKLIKFSNGNYEVAEKIIEDAIGNNYSGFFEPNKNQKPEVKKQMTAPDYESFRNG